MATVSTMPINYNYEAASQPILGLTDLITANDI